MPKPIVSFSQVVKTIAEKHNTYANGDIYAQLREMITSGVLEGEGITVFEQPTNMGQHGKTYHFDDCNKVVEIWESLYSSSDVLADKLLVEIAEHANKNKQFRSYFPNFLYRKLEQYIASRNKK